MKRVLILDGDPLINDFIKSKLLAEKFTVDVAECKSNGFSKMLTTLPDLIIIGCEKNLYDAKDFLNRKLSSPNTKLIPVILSGPILPKNQIDELMPYGVVKYFYKPIRFDIFFEFLTRVLKTSFFLDTTPSVLDIHLNNGLIFIEISQGLNRDKLFLLKYKIKEILNAEKLENPKVIVMLTNLTLSFVDGCNLEVLFDSILFDKRIKGSNVKVLSFDSFTKEFLEGHKEYRDIKVATSLQSVLHTVVENSNINNMADFINENILSSTVDVTKGSLEMTYNPEEVTQENIEEKVPEVEIQNFSNKSIALVDDDLSTLEYLKKVLSQDFKLFVFREASEFIKSISTLHYDLTILDLNMPNMNGFDVLKILRGKQYLEPVIVYSGVKNKDAVYKSLELGAKTFLPKPMKEDVLIQKVKEIILSDF